MSTRGAIARLTCVLPPKWAGRYHHWDAYPSGLGATLWQLYHDAELIERQLEWLPYRQAKNPAGYLVAAIEGDYDEPRAVRAERAQQERAWREQELRSQPVPWQDWQGQPVETNVADGAQVPVAPELSNEDLPHGDPSANDNESPDDEPSLEEVLDKADTLGPEERWISLTPDE